jgi:hypothetical protein
VAHARMPVAGLPVPVWRNRAQWSVRARPGASGGCRGGSLGELGAVVWPVPVAVRFGCLRIASVTATAATAGAEPKCMKLKASH